MNNYQEKMEKLYYYAEAWETSIGEVILELLMQHFTSAGYERNALLNELFSKSDEELMRHGSDLRRKSYAYWKENTAWVNLPPPRLLSRKQSDQRADSPRAHRVLRDYPWKYSSLFSAIAERPQRAAFPFSADWYCNHEPSIPQ